LGEDRGYNSSKGGGKSSSSSGRLTAIASDFRWGFLVGGPRLYSSGKSSLLGKRPVGGFADYYSFYQRRWRVKEEQSPLSPWSSGSIEKRRAVCFPRVLLNLGSFQLGSGLERQDESEAKTWRRVTK